MWITIQNYKDWAFIKGSDKDTQIGIMIQIGQSLIESYCNRVFSKGVRTEIYNGSKRRIFVRCPPIDSTQPVTIWDDSDRIFDSNTLISSSDYGIDYDSGIIGIEYPSFIGVMSLKITYTGGYDNIPVIGALCALVSVLMKEGPGGTLGLSSRSMPNGSVVYVAEDLPGPIRMMLDPFRLPPVSLGGFDTIW